MCRGCWGEYGKPMIISEATLRASRLVARVYGFSAVGGNLHVIVDDWNIEDRFFTGGFEAFDDKVPAAQIAAEREAYGALRHLTLAERASALAMRSGYIPASAAIAPHG